MAEISSGTLGDLLNKLYSDYQSGKSKGLGELEGAKNLYGPDYLKGAETDALAGIEQSFVGRGLSNTTLPVSASIGMKRKFQDERLRGKAGAMTNIADFISKFFPSPATLSHLATGGFSGTLQQNQMGSVSPSSNFYNSPSPWDADFMGGGWSLSGGGSGAGGAGGTGGSGSGSYSAPSSQTFNNPYGGGGGAVQPPYNSQVQAGYNVNPDPTKASPAGYNLISNQDWADIQSQANVLNPTVSPVGSAAPTGSQGGQTMNVIQVSTGSTKSISVPASALGSGPGGFKDEKTYLAYVPSGHRLA